ncbi:hypothetical protein [Sulfuricurvum sp.]|uniref:hypothetical protein n=1 Tax=Sulfuricurvum sp. TaxID=2025608 RepID=UPI003566CDBD
MPDEDIMLIDAYVHREESLSLSLLSSLDFNLTLERETTVQVIVKTQENQEVDL